MKLEDQSSVRTAAMLALHEAVEYLRGVGYRFVTPTPSTIARVNGRKANRVACDLAGVFGWSRPFDGVLLDERLLQLLRDAQALVRDGDLLRCAIRVSSIGEDLFIHSAYPTVASDAVFFGPDTYRFVAAIRARMAPSERPLRRVADIGCGAGPGGVLVARQHPWAEVTLVDINPTALAYSKLNADLAGVRNVVAVQSDLLSGVDGSFDLIVSNPPYLNDPLARAYRHGGGALGEGVSLAIVREALGRLAPRGQLILYTGVAIVDGTDPFLTAISEHLQAAGMRWSYEELGPDVFGEELENESYGGVDRIAAVVLTAIREV